MKVLFEKHETLSCILLIVAYLVVNSFCLQTFGIASMGTVVINAVFSLLLVFLMVGLKRIRYYGLTKPNHIKQLLYFVPLVLLATQNLWNGVNFDVPATEVILHILTMICIGFIEEVIFRGFLFRMMEKTNLKTAIWVNALTFGIGHIINLVNGAALVPTLLQICAATAIGYLFVMIFHRCKSIVPCVITHILINATSIFAVESTASGYLSLIIIVLISVGYAVYIGKSGAIPEQK